MRSIRLLGLLLGLASLVTLSLAPAALGHVEQAPPPHVFHFPDPPMALFADVQVQACMKELDEQIDPADVVVVAQFQNQDLPPVRRYLIAPRRP